MRTRTITAAALLALAMPAQLWAHLPAGRAAPPIHTEAALAGKATTFDLAAALKRGPVVLYFYPKAFTQGCTLETRAFAEKQPEFAAAGATIVGLSADDMATLKRFSQQECSDKFPVGIATPAIIKAYDVALKRDGGGKGSGGDGGLSDRTSYVIGQDGRIRFVHSDLDYRDHVRLTLAAVQALRAK